MMRLKRFISMLVAMVMCLTLASGAYANGLEERNNVEIVWFGDGCFYIERNPEWTLCIAAEENRDAEFAVCYNDNPGIVYQVYIPRDSESIQHVEFASSRYWENLKKEGFGYDRNAFNTIDTKRSILVEDRPTIMGAVSDLQGKLRAIYGNEYANRVIHTSNDYSPHSAKVTEYLEFSVEYVNTLTWLEAMTIAAFIAGFGLPANWAKLLSDVLGAAGVYAIIARGTSVDHYRCVALFTRYGCIDDIALSSATRSDVYDGFEHEGVVEMESYSERETIYAPSEYKYTTYSVLLHEAYDLYLAIYG